MSRDRAQRLATAPELGTEVRAWREGRPLSSYRYSRLEKVRRFVGQNRLASATAALAL